MIDTILLCGGTELEFLYNITTVPPSGNARSIRPSGPEDPVLAEKQWDFIEKTLKESKYVYLHKFYSAVWCR